MMTPNQPGVYKVTGRRKANVSQYREVRTVVEVRRYQWGARWGLAVFFFGRQNPYRLDMFDAQWELLPVEFAGEMVQ